MGPRLSSIAQSVNPWLDAQTAERQGPLDPAQWLASTPENLFFDRWRHYSVREKGIV